VMNGRYFDGRQLIAEFYDNFTNYFVEESDEDKAVRDKEWAKWLEGNDNFDGKNSATKEKEQQATQTSTDPSVVTTQSDQTMEDDEITHKPKQTKQTKMKVSDDDEDLVDDW